MSDKAILPQYTKPKQSAVNMSQPENLLPSILRGDRITPLAATTYFNALPPISLESLIGSWRGTCVLTDHPGTKPLLDVHWEGKTFRSVNDVDPIIVRDGNGKRVVNGFMGKARVEGEQIREVKYNGVVSAAMIYNEKPIIDYFRKINDHTVIGVMDALESTADHGLYFILERIGDEEDKGKL
ncbi:hypothetical protein BJY01DRAFT_256234 [Aspergillus pseudoustus]|uniref:Calycin-like protein n=1 Tax=Aspergillus pseudoustus TaxID=1810923 RepID=A0ABR4ICS0_9EURO